MKTTHEEQIELLTQQANTYMFMVKCLQSRGQNPIGYVMEGIKICHEIRQMQQRYCEETYLIKLAA